MAGKFQNASHRDAKPGKAWGRAEAAPAEALNHEHQRIRAWLKQVRFRRSLFGVSEADVWKKIAELNALYEAALSAERARYDALLARGGAPDRGQAGGDPYG